MKKSLGLGHALSRKEQQQVTGGDGSGCSVSYSCGNGASISCNSNSGDCQFIMGGDGDFVSGVRCDGQVTTCPKYGPKPPDSSMIPA